MRTQAIFRCAADIILFFFVLNGWWLAALPLGVVGLWAFPVYLEALVAGIAFDALFGMVPGTGFRGFLGTATALMAGAAFSALRRVVRK